MKVLLTNDDGIDAEGLQELRRALLRVPDIELVVIAPDGNRSAMARSITTRRPLWVQEVDFGDGTHGYATDGTPVDCVRLATLGLVEGFEAELIVSGINHGTNLGDDITYSGTVAAAFEGILLGLPAIAVSQQSTAGTTDFRPDRAFDFAHGAQFVARLVEEIDDVPLPAGHAAERQLPRRRGERRRDRAPRQAHLPRRAEAHGLRARRAARATGSTGPIRASTRTTGTDFAAIGDGHISVTPLHFDLTDVAGHGRARHARPRAPAAADRPRAGLSAGG